MASRTGPQPPPRRDVRRAGPQPSGDLGRGPAGGPARRGHGLLGVDLEPDPATHLCRIVRIFRGQERGAGPDRPPRAQPGMDVKPGDYLLAIDGAPLREGINPDSLLLDKAGQDVVVTVNSFPSLEGARRLTVRPAACSENGGDPLRYADWVSRNREAVDKASGGRIGYLHLPDTYIPGIAAFFRQAPALLHKEGLILDVRAQRRRILARLDDRAAEPPGDLPVGAPAREGPDLRARSRVRRAQGLPDQRGRRIERGDVRGHLPPVGRRPHHRPPDGGAPGFDGRG
ncbi:MAG: PDZ domain-containing protein [Ignavibacteriales bacterium]|nr:PDZ domain-containing protein [Ignavibacteriales bacterium]